MSKFLPFSRPSIDEATIASVVETLRSGWITSGPKVQEFEKQLSDYFGGRLVRTFNSGTCTMEIALRIAGIAHGDEVISYAHFMGGHRQRHTRSRRNPGVR